MPGAHVKWTTEMNNLLGKASDQDVADELGISLNTVQLRRHELGIPPFWAYVKIEWTQEINALLGTVPDAILAERLGVYKKTVRRHRLALGIPLCPERERVTPEGMPLAERQRFYSARRRQQVAGLPDTLTFEQWKSACEWFGHKCAYCGEEAFLGEDHLIPVSKGGSRTVLNIIPACFPCNNAKRATRAHIWIYRRFGMEQGKKIIDKIVAYLTEVKRGTCTDD